jgi:hypothetical protein
MQTLRANIDLMKDGQINKELVFNEAMIKIDSLINLTISDFVNEGDLETDDNFIISNGVNKNKISYINVNSISRQYFTPCNMMMVFIIKKNSFYIFNNQNWERLLFQKNKEYIGIKDDFAIDENSDSFLSIYLEGDSNISLKNIDFNEITIIIKQNCNHIFDINWSDNILWPQKGIYQTNRRNNTIDILKFYKLSGEFNYLASFETNYEYSR